MSWREDLIGKTILVFHGMGAPLLGKVAKVFEPNTFLRPNAEEGELPVDEHVLQLESGDAFLASDERQTTFKEMSPAELFVLESMQEALRAGIQAGFRVAIAAQLKPEDAMIILSAAMFEASRALEE